MGAGSIMGLPLQPLGRKVSVLLKVSDGNGGWVLFDEADQVHLSSTKHVITNQSELERLMGEDTLSLVSKDCFKGEPLDVGELSFVSKGRQRRVFFTNIAYVCNDGGDTLDRLTVREHRNKRRL